jgi:hypothetical protein
MRFRTELFEELREPVHRLEQQFLANHRRFFSPAPDAA